jgi:hypothetical protein
MLFRTLLLATLTSYAFAAALSERAKTTGLCSSCVVQTLTAGGKTITTTVIGTGVSASASSTSSSTTTSAASTLIMTATETSGTWAANFQASATAASVTCGQFNVPTGAATLALSYLKTNCIKAVIPAGSYCSAASAEAGEVSGVASSSSEGVYAFLCNLGTLPMTAQTLDQDGDTAASDVDTQNRTLYNSFLKNSCPGKPAALALSGQWLYGYVDWPSARNIGTDKLCSYPFANIRGYTT